MAKIKLNGKLTRINREQSVLNLLNILKINKKKIAVELNGKILQRTAYKKSILKNKDILEIVHFIGGG